jgi:hypothetical protein
MEEFVHQCLNHLQATHPAQDIETALRTLPTFLSPPSTTSPILSPKAFFIAFHGTLTLAFAGWPRCVRERKARIDAELCTRAGVLTEENAGTRWPKVTLGVLDEGVMLGEGEARGLLRVIADLNKELVGETCRAEEQLNSFDIVLFDVSSFHLRDPILFLTSKFYYLSKICTKNKNLNPKTIPVRKIGVLGLGLGQISSSRPLHFTCADFFYNSTELG